MKSGKSPTSLKQLGQSLMGMRVIFFLLLLVVLYGFIIWRIQTLSSVEPSADAVAAQISETSEPQIDEALVERIKQLEDTNVTIQTLFNQARQNPFDE